MAKLSVERTFAKAKAHIKKGELAEAKELYAAVLTAFPNNKKAQKSFNSLGGGKLSGDEREPPQAVIDQLINFFNTGQSAEVVKQAHNLTEQYPRSFILWHILGISAARSERFDQAVGAFQQVIFLKPNQADGYFNMGNALKDQGKFEESVDAYKKALILKADFFEAHNNMGTALRKQEKLEACIVSYQKALKINPVFFLAYNNLGIALAKQGKLEEAVEAYNKALSIKPDFSEAYNNLGNTFKDQGKLEEAISAFDKANTQIATAKALECAYALNDFRYFNQKLNSVSESDPKNIRVAAVSAFAAHQLKQKDIYPFCKDPIDMVHVSTVKDHLSNSEEFLSSLIDEMNGTNASWEPNENTTKGGFQTDPTLFSQSSANLQILENIFKKELLAFKRKFKENKSVLIDSWPDEIKLAAWYVRLLQGGHQDSHIHPSGWVSGVFYLKTIPNPVDHEGAIRFGLHGYNYPVTDKELPNILYQPSDGDLVLFPSSLFHETVPVRKDLERCVIAFDLLN
ncbi:tetratricopeptide repeat protein [Planktomarina temperata]|nr:tetratricopeptide repeat protein [Planktomarina temperata]